jgi:hypothetical protein
VPDVLSFPDGGYRFIKGVFQYSGGVAAEPGFEIIRARLAGLPPLAEGLKRIETHLAEVKRPVTAFCACELRSPKPFDDAGFLSFNKGYVEPLTRWGVIRDGVNPVARSNVCPDVAPPAEPSLYAFSYTVPAQSDAKSFVVAGSGESMEGQKSYSERAVRMGDRSPDGIREKARYVLGVMEKRMAALGFTWRDATATQVYSVYDFHHVVADEIAARGAIDGGLTWHFCRPPVDVLDYEMDVRGVRTEIVLP